ncbi:MAG: extracellular solute-binding protein [Pseudomonadota bacterium]
MLACASDAVAADRIRILSIGDPFASVLSGRQQAFEQLLGMEISIELAGYTELRRRILLNAFAPESDFDLIAIDMGWAPEVAGAGLVLPLDDLLADARVDLSSLLPSARAGATINDQIVGLPVQPHAEVLFYDSMLLGALGLPPPETTDELLSIGQALHREGANERAGICWNAQRGAALGQTMLHLLAAFGGSPLGPNGEATLDTPEMRAAIRYALALLAISPPDILAMAWDERVEAFAAGRCAMTYAWTGRTLIMERLGIDFQSGSIGVTAPPHAAGKPRVTPLGAWLLAMPANLAADRRPIALRALLRLTSEDANRRYLEAGVGTLLHTSLLADQALVAKNPAFRLLGALEEDGELMDWMRPSISQFQALSEILGTEVHSVLVGQQDVSAATAAARAAFTRMLKE